VYVETGLDAEVEHTVKIVTTSPGQIVLDYAVLTVPVTEELNL
jgi:hypothetical protein